MQNISEILKKLKAFGIHEHYQCKSFVQPNCASFLVIYLRERNRTLCSIMHLFTVDVHIVQPGIFHSARETVQD